MKLDAAIAQFAAAHPEWSTAEGAFMACEDASAAFLAFLGSTDEDGDELFWLDSVPRFEVFERSTEVPSEMAHLYAAAPDACDVHWIVVVDGMVVDFTARQYSPDAAFPLVYER